MLLTVLIVVLVLLLVGVAPVALQLRLGVLPERPIDASAADPGDLVAERARVS